MLVGKFKCQGVFLGTGIQSSVLSFFFFLIALACFLCGPIANNFWIRFGSYRRPRTILSWPSAYGHPIWKAGRKASKTAYKWAPTNTGKRYECWSFNASVLANRLRQIKFPTTDITIQMQPKTKGTVKLKLLKIVTPPDSTRTKQQREKEDIVWW